MRSLWLAAGYHLGKQAWPAIARKFEPQRPAWDSQGALWRRLVARDDQVDRLIRSLPRSDWKLALRQWGMASAVAYALRAPLGIFGALGPALLDAWLLERRVEAIKTFSGWVARRAAQHAAKRAVRTWRHRIAEAVRGGEGS